jgi:hypothetical protein
MVVEVKVEGIFVARSVLIVWEASVFVLFDSRAIPDCIILGIGVGVSKATA